MGKETVAERIRTRRRALLAVTIMRPTFTESTEIARAGQLNELGLLEVTPRYVRRDIKWFREHGLDISNGIHNLASGESAQVNHMREQVAAGFSAIHEYQKRQAQAGAEADPTLYPDIIRTAIQEVPEKK